ncbi:hypothetical protein [Bacillus sp. SD088]|nr:hypothetical protein [Bacillus sp. SD088]
MKISSLGETKPGYYRKVEFGGDADNREAGGFIIVLFRLALEIK